MKYVIVSRHPAAVEFIRANDPRFQNPVCPECGTRAGEEDEELFCSRWPRPGDWKRHGDAPIHAPEIAVLASATATDVTGATVAGNLPLHLAALAAKVIAVEFAGTPPRGAEYGAAEMEAAGARLVEYVVLTGERAETALRRERLHTEESVDPERL